MGVLLEQPWLVDLLVNLLVSGIVFAIGARNFKCTTSPIVREPYGIVGAVCVNIDVNYVRDHVLGSEAATREFLDRYCAIDMRLDENILSRPEYEKALAGKRHWRDG